MRSRGSARLALLLPLLLAGACIVSDETDENEAATVDTLAAGGSASMPVQPVPRPTTMEIEVDLGARRLHVVENGQVKATHPVAVGSREWPTPTGEWTIGQVVFNPRWVPPKEESWAKDEEVAEPGEPGNPLGRAQLVYQAPNSIHGTNEPESVGKAVSHGSIRVTNDVAIELARQVMRAGGATQDEAWIQRALANPQQRQEVSIPNPVPIRVVERSTRAAAPGAAPPGATTTGQ